MLLFALVIRLCLALVAVGFIQVNMMLVITEVAGRSLSLGSMSLTVISNVALAILSCLVISPITDLYYWKELD